MRSALEQLKPSSSLRADQGSTISGVISGSGGLTKSGPDALVLQGENVLTGPLTINSGDIFFSKPSNLGTDPSPIVFDAGVSGTGLKYIGSSSLNLTRPIELRSGYGFLRTNANGVDLQVSGVISGAGGLGISGPDSGTAYVVLSGTNTYTGPTVVLGGLAITSDAALGNGGAIELRNLLPGLRLDGPWTTSRPIMIGVQLANLHRWL
jgi:autotransporter-associated beta strand protein